MQITFQVLRFYYACIANYSFSFRKKQETTVLGRAEGFAWVEVAYGKRWVAVDPGEFDPGSALRETDAVSLLMGQLINSLERPRR